MQRRYFLIGLITITASPSLAASGSFEITRTQVEWRAMLADIEYGVMREYQTEEAFSSTLDKEMRTGVYHCKGCDLPMYSSAHKYDSGSCWPSFHQSLPDAVGTQPDNTLFTTRNGVHCHRCGSHLGHIFNDGPQPTGKRHCLNGVSLTFMA